MKVKLIKTRLSQRSNMFTGTPSVKNQRSNTCRMPLSKGFMAMVNTAGPALMCCQTGLLSFQDRLWKEFRVQVVRAESITQRINLNALFLNSIILLDFNCTEGNMGFLVSSACISVQASYWMKRMLLSPAILDARKAQEQQVGKINSTHHSGLGATFLLFQDIEYTILLSPTSLQGATLARDNENSE